MPTAICAPMSPAPGPAALVDAAVQIVQRLDPPGVGARTLSECLCLQLQALGESGLACTIAEHYLEQAGHHAFAGHRRERACSPCRRAQEAYRQIQSLSPYPCGRNSARAQDDGYVVPDVLLQEKDGVLSVAVNRAYTPELSVSSFYRSPRSARRTIRRRGSRSSKKKSRRPNGSSAASGSGRRRSCAAVRKF